MKDTTPTTKREIIIWQSNGFASMAYRPAGSDSVPASVKRADIESAKREAEEKLAAAGIAIQWRESSRLSSQYEFGGWVGEYEMPAKN